MATNYYMSAGEPSPTSRELLDKLRDRIRDLEYEYQDSERRLGIWRQRHEAATENSKSLVAENKDLAAAKTDLTNENAKLAAQVEALKVERDELDTRVRDLESDINPDTGAYRAVEHWKGLYQETKEKLKSLAEQRTVDVLNKNGHIKELREDRDTLDRVNEELTNENVRLRNEAAVANSLQMAVDAKEDEIRDLHLKIAYRDDTIKSQEIGLREAGAKVVELERRLRAAKTYSGATSLTLLGQWKEAEQRRAEEARKLGEWSTYAIASTMAAVLDNIYQGRAPQSR